MSDETRRVPGFPDYEVDELGEIYSWRRGKRRRLRGWLNNNGYRMVHLSSETGRKRVLVHRMVALSFHGPDRDRVARHLDGNCKNNRPDNLAWGTRSENMRDAIKHGTHVTCRPWLMARGDSHGSKTKPERVARGEAAANKISERQAVAIAALADLGMTTSEISRVLNVPRGAAKCVVQGKTWRHLFKEKAA